MTVTYVPPIRLFGSNTDGMLVSSCGYGQAGRARYFQLMITFVAILTGLAMLGTLATLFAGMLGIVKGSDNPGRSNALMRWRVMFQGLALGLFIVLLLLLRS